VRGRDQELGAFVPRQYEVLWDNFVVRVEPDAGRVPENVKLSFLPKHSPKDNRREDIFSLIQKEVLDNRKFSGVPGVITAVRKWNRNFNRKVLKCN
jgi:hypothetical protein